MPDYCCSHCGNRTGMLGHYMQGIHTSRGFRQFPHRQGAQSCSHEFTRLVNHHFGNSPEILEALADLRKYRPAVAKISPENFHIAVESLPGGSPNP